MDDVPDRPDEEMQEQQTGLDSVPRHSKKELTTEERYGAYFALEVIKRRDGGFQRKDKLLIASMLNTSIRTIGRIWTTAQEQIEKGLRVDVSNQRKGHVGRKR